MPLGRIFLELNSVVVSNIFVFSTLGEVIQFDQFFSDGWFNHHLVNYFDQFSMDVPPQSLTWNLKMMGSKFGISEIPGG